MTLNETGFVRVAGAELEYRMIGPPPGEAPTIVLLHEGLGCVSLWKDFPDRLAAATGLGVFVYSRRGYGRSSPYEPPWPLTYMHEEGEQVLPALLDTIGFRDGILFGHSDGASIAAIYAGESGDPRLRGLVLMAPHFFTEDAGIASIAEAKTAYETTGLRDRLAVHHGDNVDCAFWGWNRAWLDPEFRHWDIQDYLPRIEVPVLVVQGEDDQYGTADQIAAAREKCAGRTSVALLPDCRHSPHRDQPEKTLDAAAAFISSLMVALPAGQVPLPAHAHVPGTDSEPDMAPLKRVKQTCPKRVDDDRWHENVAYRYGWSLFEAGFFWEAHEIWETVWLACAPNSRERLLLRALIQLANARLKRKMKRDKASARLLEEADRLLADAAAPDAAAAALFMGVDIGGLRHSLLTFRTGLI
jgi:pimeloyl-ACP methyl ester carboxylesterase